MQLDINEFLSRLEMEKAKGLSEAELAEFIHREIRLTETTKANLMEEMTEKTADFLNDAAVKFDSYMFQLQEIEKNLNPGNLSPDQQVALNDTAVRQKIAGQMETLRLLNPGKYKQQENPDPTNPAKP